MLIVISAAAFIYGLTYQRKYFLIPYICGSLLAALAAFVVLIPGAVWEKNQGLWDVRPVDMALITAAAGILTLCEACLLVSYIRCYLYYRELERFKIKGAIAA